MRHTPLASAATPIASTSCSLLSWPRSTRVCRCSARAHTTGSRARTTSAAVRPGRARGRRGASASATPPGIRPSCYSARVTSSSHTSHGRPRETTANISNLQRRDRCGEAHIASRRAPARARSASRQTPPPAAHKAARPKAPSPAAATALTVAAHDAIDQRAQQPHRQQLRHALHRRRRDRRRRVQPVGEIDQRHGERDFARLGSADACGTQRRPGRAGTDGPAARLFARVLDRRPHLRGQVRPRNFLLNAQDALPIHALEPHHRAHGGKAKAARVLLADDDADQIGGA